LRRAQDYWSDKMLYILYIAPSSGCYI
jgi:hypothetical protein